MEQAIKTKDLCDRCRYHFNVWCNIGCMNCEMNGEKQCLCLTIKENTPCPYFREADGNA